MQRLKMAQSERKMEPREALGSHPLSQPPMQASHLDSRPLPSYQAPYSRGPQIQPQYIDKEGQRRVVIPPPKKEGAVRGFCDKSFGGVMKFLGMI